MIPVRRRWLPGDEEGMHVLVPGLMGFGFLISLIVLAADGIVRLIPATRRKRRIVALGLARSRANDLAAIGSGAPPRPGAVLRQPRRRLVSAGLGLTAASVGVVAVLFGLALAGYVGPDRQGWVIWGGIGMAIPLMGLAVVWLVAAMPRPLPLWLAAAHNYWPIGAYPDPGSIVDRDQGDL